MLGQYVPRDSKIEVTLNTFTTACYTGVARTLNAYLLTKMIEIPNFLNITVFSDID